MKIKNRLQTQSFWVLFGTAAVTLCITFLFHYAYLEFTQNPKKSQAADEIVILMENQSIVFTSHELTRTQINNILMDLKMDKTVYTLDGVLYSLSQSKQQRGSDTFTLALLKPVLDQEENPGLIPFVVVVFCITFLIASSIAQRYNTKQISAPIVKLTAETEKITAGELDTEVVAEGEGEIYQLCTAVEQLRLKLKESVYTQEKYDDNRKFLISSISHDLKTPVTAIRGYIEGILDGVAASPEKKEKYLRQALAKTDLLSSMIEDLLLYSKLDMNQIPFNLSHVDLAEYLEEMMADSLIYFEREHKQLSFQAQNTQRLFVSIDLGRFRRVIQNILDNARKHILPQEGKVTIFLRETTSCAIIEIRDNGEGISKEDLPHIFDRFYRGDNARKVSGSSGLGLAIARQIVEGLDGRIWAVSQQGTSIMISLKKVKV